MLAEYDFSGGVKGKHSRSMQKGYIVKVRHPDGSVTTRYFSPSKTSIVLDKDVQKFFPDSESVNRQLRACIAEKRKRQATKTGENGPKPKLAGPRVK